MEYDMDAPRQHAQSEKAPELSRGLCTNVISEATGKWEQLQSGADGRVFVAASSATAAIFECMGSVVSPVKADMQGNTDKIQQNVAKLQTPLTIQQMIDREIEIAGSAQAASKEGSTTLAMVWLGRMLRLVARMVDELDRNPSKSPTECILAGYSSCLSPHHPWAQRLVITTAIKACPSRRDFIAKLGADEQAVEGGFRPFHEAINPVLQQLQQFLIDKNLDQPDK
jgi:hypothetical protein